MRDGPKNLNLGLTIMTMMVMILAGASIFKVKEADATWTDFTFYIEPKDDNNITVYNCEAKVENENNSQEYAMFSQSGNLIAIQTSSLNWNKVNNHNVRITVIDSGQQFYAAPIFLHLGIGFSNEIIQSKSHPCFVVEGYDWLRSDQQITNGVTSNTLRCIYNLPTRNSINVKPLQQLYFSSLFSVQLDSSGEPFDLGYYYNYQLQFKLTIYHSITLNGVKTVIGSNYDNCLDADPNQIDNTDSDENGFVYGESVVLDPRFEIGIPGHTYITGYFHVELYCSWTINAVEWIDGQGYEVEITSDTNTVLKAIQITYT